MLPQLCIFVLQLWCLKISELIVLVTQPVTELSSYTLALLLYLKVKTPIFSGNILSGNPKANENPDFAGWTLCSSPTYLLSAVTDLIVPPRTFND